VREVWCWRNGIEILALRDGHYTRVAESATLPGFPVKISEDLIQRRKSLGENQLISEFAAAIAKLPR